MKCFVISLLLLSPTLSYAIPYDLTSEKAQLVKQVTPNTAANAELSQNKSALTSLPKVEEEATFVRADLFEKGNLKVTKKVSVNGNSNDQNNASFSYNVNIGIKVKFI